MNGVLFDLDGVITDTAALHFKAWSKLAKDEFDVTLPDTFEDNLKGISRKDSILRILDFINNGQTYTEAQLDRLAVEKNDYYLKEINQLTAKDVLPGINDLIDHLREKKILLSIASASKNAPAVLKSIGLFDKFDAIADPAEVKHGKPAPDIFIEAARKINLKPEECVGLEDAAAGVQAINSAKAISIGIGDSKVLAAADNVVAGTGDLTVDLLENTYHEFVK